MGNRAVQRFLLGSAQAPKQVDEGDMPGREQAGSASRSSADPIIQRWTERGEAKQGGDKSPAGPPPAASSQEQEEEDSLIREHIAQFYSFIASVMPVDIAERREFLLDLKQAGLLPVHPDQGKLGFRPVEHTDILHAPETKTDPRLDFRDRLSRAVALAQESGYRDLMPAFAKEAAGTPPKPVPPGPAPSEASSI